MGDASNPASLESLAALMNNMRKVEQDPDENFTPDELVTDVKVDFSGGFNAASAHTDPPLQEENKVESKDLSYDCGAAATMREKRKRGPTDFHDESDSAHDDEKVDIAGLVTNSVLFFHLFTIKDVFRNTKSTVFDSVLGPRRLSKRKKNVSS